MSAGRLSGLRRSPVLHFLLLGGLLYAVASVARDPLPPGSRRIVLTSGQLDSLAVGWARAWKRPPTQEEFLGLARDHVREEIAVREARALGLDRGDPIIRRRLAQKLEFLTDDVAPTSERRSEGREKRMGDLRAKYEVVVEKEPAP